MSISTVELEELQRLEDISTNAAAAVSDLIEGSFVSNDGAASFVYISFPGEVNSEGDEMHATAGVDTLDNGENAKWIIHYDFGVEIWESEFDHTTDPATVVAWVNETLAKHRS